MSEATVRLATMDDMRGVLRMTVGFYREAKLDRLAPYDKKSMARTVERLINLPEFVLVIAENGKTLVGMAGAVIYPHIFNANVQVAQETFWWLHPESRGAGTGRALLEALESWAREKKATSMAMMLIADLGADRVAEMYKKAGYRHAESGFVKEL